MKTTKTVKEWFKTLPPELAKTALKQASYGFETRKCGSLSAAINSGLAWYFSKERSEFWSGFFFMLQWAETGDEKFLDRMPGKEISEDYDRAKKFLEQKGFIKLFKAPSVSGYTPGRSPSEWVDALVEFKHMR